MPPRRGGGGRESGERRPRRGDSLRRESSGARRSPRPRRRPSYDEATASDDDGYAESLSEASERVMKQLGAAQAAFCAAPAPQPQLLPSPSVLYDKLSTQARRASGERLRSCPAAPNTASFLASMRRACAL
jgi:hypothetical protein